jgi:hypothetical protein
MLTDIERWLLGNSTESQEVDGSFLPDFAVERQTLMQNESV